MSSGISSAKSMLRSARPLGHRTWRRLFLAAILPAQRVGGATGVLTAEPAVMGGGTRGNLLEFSSPNLEVSRVFGDVSCGKQWGWSLSTQGSLG